MTGKPKHANVSLTGNMYKRNKEQCRSHSESLGPFYQETDGSGMATFHVCMNCEALQVSFRVITGDLSTCVVIENHVEYEYI